MRSAFAWARFLLLGAALSCSGGPGGRDGGGPDAGGAPDAAGVDAGPACLGNYGSCTRSAECCSGLLCVDGGCLASMCSGPGVSCSANEQCCGGLVCQSDGGCDLP